MGQNNHLYRLPVCLKLHDISAVVRRRTLFSFRALAEYEPALIDRIGVAVISMLEDVDDSVMKATLTLVRNYPPQVSYASILCRRGIKVA